MNTKKWVNLLNKEVEKLRSESSEVGQDKMISAFHADELARVEMFQKSEDVGCELELINLFDRFQSNYMYENNCNFSLMAVLEGFDYDD